MAESTGNMSFTDLRLEVARFVQVDTDASTWDTNTTTLIDGIIKSGLKRFYQCGATPSAPRGHDWSFLRVAGTIETTAGDWQYDLPDDFGSMHGPLTYSSVTHYPALREIGEQDVLRLRQRIQDNARPCAYAIRHKTAPGASAGQRWEILLHQPPDAVYTLAYRYRPQAAAMTTAAPYPYGSGEHGETILAACLAVAEKRVNDAEGVHAADYARLLDASVVLDQRRSPEGLGYNGNVRDRRPPTRDGYIVTYGGVEYD